MFKLRTMDIDSAYDLVTESRNILNAGLYT